MKIKKAFLIFAVAVAGSLSLLLLSTVVYANFTVGMFTSIAIVMGSLYSYRMMILKSVGEVEFEDSKDAIDIMDDPYDLYEEESELEIADIKQMIKEEKAKQKSNVFQNTTKNGSAWVSIYRLIPYAFLILGFIALENNHALKIIPYLVGLGAGIPLGYFIAKKLFIENDSSL
jgi:hypothetical protein